MLTTEQLELRKTCLGSSDMAAVLGINPFRSAWDVWADKRDLIPPSPGNAATELGNLLESAVLDHAESELGSLLRGEFRSIPTLHLGAHPDAIVRATGEPVEAKTSGIAGPIYGDWGDEGTDHVPDCYIVQGHVQMICTGKSACNLYALLGGRGLIRYRIPRSEKLSETIADKALDFWETCIVGGQEPKDSKPDLEILKRIRREPGRICAVPPVLGAEVNAAIAARKAAKELEEQLKAKLLAFDPLAEAFDCGDAEKWFTYFQYDRAGYVVKPTSFRKLQFVKRR